MKYAARLVSYSELSNSPLGIPMFLQTMVQESINFYFCQVQTDSALQAKCLPLACPVPISSVTQKHSLALALTFYLMLSSLNLEDQPRCRHRFKPFCLLSEVDGQKAAMVRCCNAKVLLCYAHLC